MSRLLVVGGSKGIGHSILKEMLDKRECVNISRTSPEEDHSNLTHYNCDILEDELPDLENIGQIIYCPGSITLKPIGSLKESHFVNDFNINVIGAVKVIQKYSSLIKNDVNASIVLFSTVAVKQGMPFHSSIAVAKAGVEALSKSLAAELAPKIRVNCIAPSITDTPLASGLLKNEKSVENIKQKHPLKKILNASEVASLACYLVSSAASGITGQTIGVDSGLSTLRI